MKTRRPGLFGSENRVNCVSLVLIGTLVSLVLYFLYPLSLRRQKPRLETLPTFVDAVKALEEGRCTRAVESLKKLKEEYPDEPLLHLYLAFALSCQSQLVGDGRGYGVRERKRDIADIEFLISPGSPAE